MIRWELPSELFTDSEGKDMPRMIGKTYTKSLSENAALRKMLEGWRGKKFSDDELQGFDLTVLLGLPCMLTVTHSSSNGKTYADISGVAAMPKGMEAPPQVYDNLAFDLDAFDALNNIDSLPEFIQEQIKKSKEWEIFAGGNVDDGIPETLDDMPF